MMRVAGCPCREDVLHGLWNESMINGPRTKHLPQQDGDGFYHGLTGWYLK